jgi:hypothetical protein
LPVLLRTAMLLGVITEADVAAIITSVARSAALPPGSDPREQVRSDGKAKGGSGNRGRRWVRPRSW